MLATAVALTLAFGLMGWVSFTEKTPDTLTVHVRRGDTGEALPNLEVWAGWLRGSSDLELDIKRIGKPLRTDAQGNLTIKREAAKSYLFARHEDLVGLLYLPIVFEKLGKFTSEVDFELTAERSFTVRALNQDGQPVPGVLISKSVIFRKSFLSRMRSWWQGRRQIGWSPLGRTSESDGTLSWKGLVYYVQARKWDKQVMTGIRLRAQVPGHEQVSIEVSPLPSHGDTIDLRLPSIGELTIQVTDPRGRPALGRGELKLQPVVIDPKVDGKKRRDSGNQTYIDGEAHFPAVAPNTVFEVSLKGRYGALQTKRILGPTDREPDAVRTLVLDEDLLLVRGRALDTDGEPYANELLSAKLRTEDHQRGRTEKTGDDGSFLIALPGYLVDKKSHSAFLRLPKHKLEVDLTARMPFRRGLLELGDVVFDDGVQLLSGVVHDADGLPCEQRYSLRVEHRSGKNDSWKALPVRSEIENGRFRVFGKLVRGSYRLFMDPIRRHHIPPEPIAFSPGQEELGVHLKRGHTLEVLLHAPAEQGMFWRAMLSFRLQIRPTPGSVLDQQSTELARELPPSGNRGRERDLGHLFWNSLAAGSYECEAYVQGASNPFHVIRNIQVPGDGGDPACVEMDLANHLREIHLAFKPIDETVPKQTVRVHLLHENRLMPAIIGSREDVAITILPGAFDAWVLAPGYIPMLIESLEDDHEVPLTPSTTALSARLASSVDLPEGVVLRVGLEAVAKVPPDWQIPMVEGREPHSRESPFSPFHQLEHLWPARCSGMLDFETSAQIDVQRPGRQEITLELVPVSVAERQRWDSASVPIEGFAPMTFDLKPSTETQTLSLQVTQAAVDTALRSARIR